MRYLSAFGAVVAMLCLHSWADTAAAQGNSLFGSSGPVGSSAAGSGSSGGTTGLGTGLGTAGTLGTGAAGTTNLSSVVGQNGTTTTAKRTGMVGRDDSAGRFVGQTQAGAQNLTAANQGNRNATTGRNRNGNANNANANQNRNQTGSNSATMKRKQVRPQLKVAFSYSAPHDVKMEGNLTTRFDKLSERIGARDVAFDAEKGVLTLRGEVDTEHARRLAANVARMEPGVRSVRNELTVKAEPAPEETTVE